MITKKRSVIFSNRIKKKSWPKKWDAKATEIAGQVKKDEKLEEYKVTVQRLRLKLGLLNVQNDPWKTFNTVTWKNFATH